MEQFMDIINQLVLEHKKDLSFYDIDHFVYATSQMMGESVAMAILPDPTKYCQYIDKILSYTDRVTMTADNLVEFYSKVYKSPLIDEKDISIPVQSMEDIEKIRPEYLSGVPMEFDKVVSAILKGTIKESEIRTKYVAGEYFNKLRKQLVKTTIPYNDVKDLMINNDPAVVHITSVYIQSSVIPFLRSYNQNIKDLTATALNTKGRIINTHTDIMNSMNALNTVESSGKLDTKQLRLLTYFKYNMFRQYMNVCAYLVTLIIRKMKYYTFNIMSFINLYNTIYNYFPEGEYILHEYVEGDDIRDLDDTTLLNSILNNELNVVIPHIHSAINRKRISLSNLMAKRHNVRINYQDMDFEKKYPYDTRPYAIMNQTIINIVKDLHNFEVNSQDPNMIVDDVLTKSHMDTPFISQYSDTLSNVDSMEFYTAQGSLINGEDESVVLSLYSDLSSFEKNISTISSNIAKAYQYITALNQKFEMNVNNLDDNTYNEYKSTMETIEKNFKEYALYVAKKLLSRLDNMVTLMDDGTPDEDPSDPTPEISTNYVTPSYLEAYDEICDLEKTIFESMLKEYYSLRKQKDTGAKVLFEDTGEVPANSGSSPSVKTDASTQHAQNDSNTTTTTNTTETKESIVEKFKKWVQEILNKFMDKSSKITSTNNKWIASVKDEILALDTSNTTINMAKYDGVESQKLVADIQSATNKINSINANALPADLKSKAKAETYIFPSIPARVGNETNFTARIKQFFTFGNTDKTNLISYSGDDAKTKIASMIEFCEGYENAYKNVSNELDKLGKAAADKQQAIINALGTQAQTTTTTTNNKEEQKPATESVMMEADAQTQAVNMNGASIGDAKKSKEKISSSSMITSVTREYTGAILTVLEKKYLDYIKVLSKLAPKKNNVAPQKGEEKTEEPAGEQK